MKKKSSKAVRYNKWGYIFLIPFILVYVVFQLIPLFNTIYNSFFENYLSGLTQIGPNFVGLKNYKTLFTQGDIWIYAKNTMILWIMCFVPQIILSLLLGAWFSDVRLKLKGSRFFKTVIYLPNHGIRIFHVVLYTVLGWWTDQLDFNADRNYFRAI